MDTLENEVLNTVQNFIGNNTSFTALDVSNEVKKVHPQARHIEIRNIVRSYFRSDIEPLGWARTPITVTLVDGSTTDALLYHPLSDSWDLDIKYDSQKRSQVACNLNPSPGTVSNNTGQQTTITSDPVTQPTSSVSDNKNIWQRLFNKVAPLFPTK